MEVEHHLAALEREGALLLEAAAAAGPEAIVPSCPGWHVRDLLAHLGYVHRWATGYVLEGHTELVAGPDEAGILAAAPPDGELLEWIRDGHVALVTALAAAPEDLACWTFLAAKSPRLMWTRRQAHETAVHRVDVELAAGRPVTAVRGEFAADGCDELCCAFYTRRRVRPGERLVARIGLAPTDHAATWTLAIHERAVRGEPGLRECDLVVRAPVGQLYLALWNRNPGFAPQLEGRAALLGLLRERVRVTWS